MRNAIFGGGNEWGRGTLFVCIVGLAFFTGVSGCQPQGLGYVGNDTCLACHNGKVAEDKQNFLTSPHADAISCEGCHGPGYLHVRNGGRYGLFISEAEDMRTICAACHQTEVTDFLKSEHGEEDEITCANCHDPHTDQTTLRPFADNQVCLQCHAYVSDFSSEAIIQQHTFHSYNPGGTGASRCVACHMVPKQRFNQLNGAHDHSMLCVPPITSNQTDTIPVPPNSCSGVMGCHDGTVNTAPVFDVDDPAANITLQGIFETRYGS